MYQDNALGKFHQASNESLYYPLSVVIIISAKKISSEVLSEYEVTYLLRNKWKLEELGNR